MDEDNTFLTRVSADGGCSKKKQHIVESSDLKLPELKSGMAGQSILDISHISAAKSTVSSHKNMKDDADERRSSQSSNFRNKMVASARNKSQAAHSRYAKIPTENLKFQQFMEILLKSGIDKDTI